MIHISSKSLIILPMPENSIISLSENPLVSMQHEWGQCCIGQLPILQQSRGLPVLTFQSPNLPMAFASQSIPMSALIVTSRLAFGFPSLIFRIMISYLLSGIVVSFF
jgi:hypothetical protein